MQDSNCTSLRVIDSRTHSNLDSLDGFIIFDGYVLLYDQPPQRRHVDFELPFTTDEAHERLAAWPDGIFQTDFSLIPDLHPIAAAYIEASSEFDYATFEGMEIFVDGSTAKDDGEIIAAYSMVVTTTHINDDETTYSLLGYTGGIVSLDQREPSWLGAIQSDSMEAECCAVLIALLWILQSDLAKSSRTTISFDCTAAGFAASGDWKCRADSITAQLARGLCQSVQELMGSKLKLKHVPGHANIPGNELADSIAKAVARQQIPCWLNMLDCRNLVHHIQEFGNWIWLRYGTMSAAMDLPPMSQSAVPLPATLPRTDYTQDINPVRADPNGSDQKEMRLFNLCSINVRSLFDDGSTTDTARRSNRFTEKGQYLADQLHWYGYDLVGIQESCTKHQGTTSFGNYLRLVGGADEKGQLGCELWISKQLCGRQVAHRHLTCLHNDPRRLLVRLQHVDIDVSILVLHAPHNGYKDDRLKTWWKETISICRLADLNRLLVLADCNAQMPLPQPPHVGELTHGRQSLNTKYVLDLCMQCGLCLPSTFPDIHPGDNGTWTHPSGCVLRIDYIMVPVRWLTSVISSWVDAVIDLNQSFPDHRPIGCQLQIECGRMQLSPTGYNLPALRQQSIRSELDDAIRRLPPIPWNTDVHHHAQLIREGIHQALQETVPKMKSAPRQSFISANTWGIRQRKLELKKQLQHITDRICIIWLRWAYMSWSKGVALYIWYRPHLQWLFRMDRLQAQNRVAMRQLTQLVRTNLRKDRTDQLVQLSEQCASQPLHQVFATLRRVGVGATFRKRANKPLPVFRRADGQLSTSAAETAECWRLHCQQLEAGEIMTTQQLLGWAEATWQHRSVMEIAVDHIPSLQDLEKHLRKMCPGKAPGADKVPSDICHWCPAATARYIFPLLLKETLTCTEPLEWKGGTLVYAYKGRGRHDQVSSYRGLMLTSVVGKAVRSALREKILPSYRRFLHDTYYSARASGHVGQACMTLQLFTRVAKSLNHSTAVLFLDIRSAYYAICRELATGWTGTDAQLSHIFQHFNLPATALQELWRTLDNIGSATSAAELDAAHQALLTELSTATWFCVHGSEHLTITHGGSRPGDGLADVIFAFIFGRMIKMLQRELLETGHWDSQPWQLSFPRSQLLHHTIHPANTPSTLDVIWADDLAFAVRGRDAQTTVDQIQYIGGRLFDWCYRHGMQPNTDKGKSEILLQLRGHKSRSLRAVLFAPDAPTLPLPTTTAPPAALYIVAMYKHLGAQLHIGGKLLKEVKVRGGIMSSTYNSYAKKVFHNPNLPLKARGQLLDALIYSVLRWNAGAWYELDSQTFSRYNAAVMTLARRTCITPHGAEKVWSWRDDDILFELNLPSPEETLHLSRISFYTTAVHTAPDALWVLILAEGSWIRCVRNAVYWMFCQLQNSTPHSVYHEFETAWIQGIQLRGQHWKGWIARAKKHAVLQRHNKVLLQRWHEWFFDALRDIGFDDLHATAERTNDVEHPFACGPCKQVFRTYTAWCTHAHKRHGRSDPLRHFLHDGKCKCCLSDYHTTRRLLAHLHHDRRCAVNHVALSDWRELGPGRGATQEDRDRELPLPVLRPRWKTHILADEEEDIARATEALTDYTFRTNLAATTRRCSAENLTPRETSEEIRQLLLSSVVNIADAWDAIVGLLNGLPETDPISEGLRLTTDLWSLEWLFRDCMDEVTWPVAAYRNLNLRDAKTVVTMKKPPWSGRRIRPQVNPRLITKELFVIHFCSGVRREGDIQWWTERMDCPCGHFLTTISVDIIFHSQRGDLTSTLSQQRWLNFLRTACVCAIYLGPPCSTWSISRWRNIWENDGGPRPTRSVEEPYGLTSMGLGELRDIILGNTLLLFSFAAIMIQASLDRIGVLEHPAPRDMAKYPCIWGVAAFQHLLRLENLRQIDIFQGLFGAISPKPTRLAICGHQSPDAHMDKFRITDTLPPPLTMGWNKEQGFSTSQLKEYPTAMARGLAGLAESWIHTHCTEDNCVEPATPIDYELVEPFKVDLVGLFARGADTRGMNP